MNPSTNHAPLLLYDGSCFVCSSSVQFVRRIDKNKKIGFLALQSPDAQKIIANHPISIDLDTVLLFHHDRFFQKSEAIFEVIRIVSGGWRLFLCFRIIPLRWRDGLYDFIARNRYRWFGRKDGCEW
ncbi:MAG TPA: DUF393 domain-containing protein [Saprospiraceae bacterium]|nr:DUF393 domain-containing protein [Saprospiraceae bacterium]